MKPIGDYRQFCEGVTLEDFLSDDPPGVFLHHAAMGALNSLKGTPGRTGNRVVFDDDSARHVPGAISRAQAYSVLPILSKSDRRDGWLVIGCGAASDIFLDDVSVSRKHAWIERREDAYFIGDLESRAGTRVNGEDLRPGDERELRSGNSIALGQVGLLFIEPVAFYNFVRRFLG